MKNKSEFLLKRLLLILTFEFLNSFTLAALTQKTNIIINVVNSFSRINEYVFENTELLSEINWNGYRPGLRLGIEYCISNFDFLFSVYSAIPVESGYVIDRDFFTTGSNKSKATQYSKHDLITDKDYSFNLEAWYSVPLSKVRFSLGLSGIYSNFKAETDDGYLQYPQNSSDVWTGNEDKYFLNGTAITYEQQRLFAGFGFMVSSNWQQSKHLTYFVKGFWFPFVRIDAIDNHFLRLIQFCDSLNNKAHGFSVSGTCSYYFSENCGLNLSVIYRYLEAEGTTKTSPIGIITYNTADSGEGTVVKTDIKEFQINIGGVFKI